MGARRVRTRSQAVQAGSTGRQDRQMCFPPSLPSVVLRATHAVTLSRLASAPLFNTDIND